MRERRVFVAVLSTLIAALFCSSSFANNGIQNYEFSFSRLGIYVACLGESIDVYGNANASFHLFETPSGRVHILDNWKTTYFFISSSGRTWYAKAPSSFLVNTDPSGITGTLQTAENLVAKPLTGDGPKFKYHSVIKVTVNANGDLVVDFGLDLPDRFRCIGSD